METDEKKCPYCAEIIKAEAIKCKYCWSELSLPEQKEEPARELKESTLDVADEEMEIFPYGNEYVEDKKKSGGSQQLEHASEETILSPEEPIQAGLGKVARDIEANGKLAFEKGEVVEIEPIEVDGEKRYEAISIKLDNVFEVAEEDIITDNNAIQIEEEEPWWKDPKSITIAVIVSAVAITLLVFLILSPAKTLLYGSYVVIAAIVLFILVAAVAVGWSSADSSSSSSPRSSSSSSSYMRSLRPKRVCPTCGSTRVARFSRTWKVTKIASVGVFGLGNVHKTMHCRNCGYKW